MAVRSGVPSLIEVAVEMCRLIQRFEPVIRAISNNDPAVIAALAAAMAACETLRQSLIPYRQYGD